MSTLPRTINDWKLKEKKSFWDGICSAAILVSGSVMFLWMLNSPAKSICHSHFQKLKPILLFVDRNSARTATKQYFNKPSWKTSTMLRDSPWGWKTNKPNAQFHSDAANLNAAMLVSVRNCHYMSQLPVKLVTCMDVSWVHLQSAGLRLVSQFHNSLNINM